jgi:hypothetical protein
LRRERSVDWPRAGSCRDLSQRRDRRDFIEADFQALPGGASAFRHLNIPRYLFSEAAAAAARRAAKSKLIAPFLLHIDIREAPI